MSALRALLAGIFFLAYAVGSVVVGFLLFPVLFVCGRRRETPRRLRAVVRASYRLFVWAGRVTRLFRVEISAADRERLSAVRGAVVVANHLTLIDIVVLLAVLPEATAVAKAAAARNPFYARVVKSVFLVNDDPEGVLKEAAHLLAAGVNLVVFPEGTRTPAETLRRKLHRGAAQIALAAGADLVPIRLGCTPPVLGKGQPWHEVGDRTVVYTLAVGETIAPPVAAESRHAAAVRLTEEIGARLFA